MKFRKLPVEIEASQWFVNGDHPEDFLRERVVVEDGRPVVYSGADAKALGWEGSVVRYFRHPGVSGMTLCEYCAANMHSHGWIDTLEGGHTVCPGDFIITGVKGERYPCKPDIFDATYEVVK